MDEPPDFKYAKIRDRIEIKKLPDGIHLEFIQELGVATIDESLPQEEEKPKTKDWKIKMQEFIENGAVNTKLTIKDISLDPDEMEEAEQLIEGVKENFWSRIKSDCITLLKIDIENPPNL